MSVHVIHPEPPEGGSGGPPLEDVYSGGGLELVLVSAFTPCRLETCHHQRERNDPHEKHPQYIQESVLPYMIDDVHVTHLGSPPCRTVDLCIGLSAICPVQLMLCYGLG